MTRQRAPEESELVLAFRATGNKDAASTLILRYYRPVYRYLYRLAGNTADAEDVTNETFLRVWSKLATLREPSRFKPWLFQIAHSAFLNWIRKSGREPVEPAVLSAVPDESPSPEASIISRQKDDLIRRAVDDLPPAQREAVQQYHFASLRVSEIADVRGVSRQAVRKLLNKAHDRLRLAPAIGRAVASLRRIEEADS